MNLTPEERRALEEAKRKAQEMLEKMTPEERAQTEKKAQEAIAETSAPAAAALCNPL